MCQSKRSSGVGEAYFYILILAVRLSILPGHSQYPSVGVIQSMWPKICSAISEADLVAGCVTGLLAGV